MLSAEYVDGRGKIIKLEMHEMQIPAAAYGIYSFKVGEALGAAGFIVIVVLTVLFGRVYCSTFCSLGTLQDVIDFAARKSGWRRGFRFSEPHDGFRYAILALTVLLLLAGSGFLLNLLNPFSSFGRIFADLFRPVVLLVSNLAR